MKPKTAVILIVVILFSILFLRYSHRAPKRNYSDFRVYYAAAERFQKGESLYSRPDEAITPYKYSPMFALLFSPLALFSQKTAGLIFFTLSFISLILLILFSKRLIKPRPPTTAESFLMYVVPAVFCLRFALQVLDSGQINIVMVCLVAASIFLFERRQSMLGAALFALSVMFKYTPIIFVPYFLLQKKFKETALIAVFMVIYLLLPAIFVGWNRAAADLGEWLPSITQTSLDRGSYTDYKNQSIYSMVIRAFLIDAPYGRVIPCLDFQAAWTVGAAAAFALYLFAVLPAGKKSDPVKDISLLFICLALFNPNAWMINFVALIFPVMAITHFAFRRSVRRILSVALAAAFLLGSIGSEFLVGDEWQRRFDIASFLTLSSLLLAVAFIYLKFRKAESV